MCLSIGTPKNINFPFGTTGKLMVSGVPVLKHFSVPWMNMYVFNFSCAESIAMVANISKHSKYITTSIGFIQDQIRKYPSIVEELQVGF